LSSAPGSPLTTARDLATGLGRDDEVIVDCRFLLAEPDRGEAEYLEGHIPGAVYAHLDRDLSGPMSGTNGRHPWPSIDRMAERFSTWGIDDEAQVVVYDTAGGQIAARLWWMLRSVGHDAVAVLDGGLRAWQASGGELRGGREERRRRVFTPQPRDGMIVDAESLSAYRLLDARAGERFRGETEPLDPVAGHIPGARNHPTSANLDEQGQFLDPDILRRLFDDVISATPIESVVSYCGSGVTACHNLLAMEVAGLPGARLYPGSWSEWCSDPQRGVETGTAAGA
jgi:thiosulfate/3-mercaptopyruvate sulfurtransferase